MAKFKQKIILMKSKISYVVLTLIFCVFTTNSMFSQQKKKATPKMEQLKVIPVELNKEMPGNQPVSKAKVSKTIGKSSEMQMAPMEDLTDPKQAAIEKKRLQARLKKLEAQQVQSAEARKERDRITALVKKRLEGLNSKKQMQSSTKATSDKKKAEKQKDEEELAKKIEENLTKKN